MKEYSKPELVIETVVIDEILSQSFGGDIMSGAADKEWYQTY